MRKGDTNMVVGREGGDQQERQAIIVFKELVNAEKQCTKGVSIS